MRRFERNSRVSEEFSDNMKLGRCRRFDQRSRAVIYGAGHDRTVEHAKCPAGVVIAVVSSGGVRLLRFTDGECAVVIVFF